MSSFSNEDASLHFAKALNGTVWELLQQPERTKSENELMMHAAHASCYHWLIAGKEVQHQRAVWLVARVYTELGLAESAIRHAARCLELTAEHADVMQDFDRAYAYEGIARAHALAGNREEALNYIKLAEESGHAIGNAEDKRIFQEDFDGGKWYGVR